MLRLHANGGSGSISLRLSLVSALLLLLFVGVRARPLIRNIRSTHEFDRLLSKHATETGLPVVVDFYSDSCGPCRMMAPVFKTLAHEIGQDKAVFVKVDTNALYELSSRYEVRSLPTFMFFLHGKKWNQFAGAGEAQLRQMTDQVVQQSQFDNVLITLDEFVSFYKSVDASKAREDVESIYKKCADLTKPNPLKQCVGGGANQLARKLKNKYGKAPNTTERFDESARKPSSDEGEKKSSPSSSSSKRGDQKSSNLQLATKDELRAELERRLDEERDAQVEAEGEYEDEPSGLEARWKPGPFPERVIIIGGGPAGMSAAIYAARAGLTPLVICPSMGGGQLQGKGVEVENYPGLHNITGPGVIAAMRTQAIHFGAVFEDDLVIRIDASERPLQVIANSTGSIRTHTIIVATGAESNWLDIPGEYEMRGGGVSSCATCDGFLFAGKHVVVIGGGDAAMEDALVLARTSRLVTVIHRRDSFRASKVLAQRVMDHPSISIRWNTTVREIVGEYAPSDPATSSSSSDEDLDLDVPRRKLVTGIVTLNVHTKEESRLACDAVFVAIGHTPTTSFLQGVVDFDAHHPGYIQTFGAAGSTRTSVPGIFAAGDVADPIYRQAITSAGSGAAAALDAERWLSEEGLGNEAAALEAELLAELMGGDDGRSDTASSAYNVYEDAGSRVVGMKESLAGAEL